MSHLLGHEEKLFPIFATVPDECEVNYHVAPLSSFLFRWSNVSSLVPHQYSHPHRLPLAILLSHPPWSVVLKKYIGVHLNSFTHPTCFFLYIQWVLTYILHNSWQSSDTKTPDPPADPHLIWSCRSLAPCVCSYTIPLCISSHFSKLSSSGVFFLIFCSLKLPRLVLSACLLSILFFFHYPKYWWKYWVLLQSEHTWS